MTDTDRRVLRGRQTRSKLLDRAAASASELGLEGLTLARLADDLGVSKSGVAAMYGSKESLQLATVEHARAVFVDAVVAPVSDRPAGLDRLDALLGSWLAYVRDGVFPGGCFLQHCLAEQASRPGPIRDALAKSRHDWLGLLAGEVAAAQTARTADPDQNPDAVAFELEAVLAAGNRGHLLGDERALAWARAACSRQVEALRTGPRPARRG